MDHHRQAGRNARGRARKGFHPKRRKLSLERLELREMLSASSIYSYGDTSPQVSGHDHSHAATEDLFIPPSQHLYDRDGFLTSPQSGNALDIAIDYLLSHSASIGLRATDLSGFEVSSQYVSQHNGVTHIYLNQTFGDLEIVGANININISPLGEVINVGSSFITGLGNPNALVDSEPTLGAGDALVALADFFDWSLDVAPAPLVDGEGGSENTADQSVVLPASGVSLEDIPAELVYVPLKEGGVELAWRLLVQTTDYDHAYNASVSATDGELLSVSDWVSDAGYNVYEMPVKHPLDGSRTLVTDPQDSTASPYGWHDTNGSPGAEQTVTRGNNVHAYTDRNADNSPDANSSPDGGSGLNFDFPLNLGQQPVNYSNAAVTNLFYWNNIIHDVMYQYGFDEASGNFQVNNYGNGGLANDDVRAEAQDGTGKNNANFFTPPDGQRPRMQMFEFDLTDPQRDGDLDNLIIVHEYGHGISNRLVGGPLNVDALNAIQSGSMGEGWGDWFGLMLSQETSDAKTGAYPVGTYVLGQPNNGTGIRRYPYSFNMAVDPLTYGDVITSSGVHQRGEIWCSALWDLNWLLIDEHGFDSDIYNAGGTGGNTLAMQLVIDSMKLMPANPSFLDSRDAILLADQLLTGGANNLIIWTAFARRGMGFSADDGGSGNSTAVTEAFDLPTTPLGNVSFDASGYKVGDVVTVSLSDLDLAGQNTVNLVVTASGGDSATIILNESSTIEGYFTGTLPTAAIPQFPGNGTLEVAIGEIITVTYNDADDGTGTPRVVTDTAEILDIVTIYEATMDTNPGWSFTGQWAYGHPTGGGTEPGDPNSGHTGQNVVGYNLNGDHANNISSTFYATTPAIDCSDFGNVKFSFQRWLGIEPSTWDHANIQVSNDGDDWVTVWQHDGGEILDTEWVYQEFDISTVADGEETVYLRWGLGPTDTIITYYGWNLDDVVVSGSPLVTSTVGSIAGVKWNDRNGDGNRDSNEPGLPGWVIYLDQNNDQQVVTTHRLEPDDFGAGTILNAVNPQATLSAVGATTADVFAGVPVGTSASTGLLGFTHNDPTGWGANKYLRIDFANPVDVISLDVLTSVAGRHGILEAYDALGVLLTSATTDPLTVGATATLTIARESADIAYVVVRGDTGDNLSFDNLLFTQTDKATVTDANGFYQFLDLVPGNYRVREVGQTGWVETFPGDSPLDATLNRITANYSDITSLVPTRFNFSGGITGTNIFDGGSDMYDTGNFLNTDLAQIIPYTAGDLASGDAYFGEASQYFTVKVPGLFALAATNTSINEFNISGNSGTDGQGSVDGTTLATTVNGRDYTIFVKRIYGSGDPSINHIIMVPSDGTGLTQFFSFDTNDDYHLVSGLSTVNEIYYALVSRDNGGYLADDSVLNIANEFLSNVAFAQRSVISVEAGDDFTDIHFGNRALKGSIRGQKWNDLNDNGIKDDGEPGLAGWQIYIDANRNAEFDAGEVFTLTDSNGRYVFADLEPGEYEIGEVIQSGWRQTHPGIDSVENLIVNGDFETGGFGGWTVVDSGSGTYSINDGTFDPASPDGPLPPLSGNFSALSHQGGPGLHVLYQDIVVPAEGDIALSWKDRIRNHATIYSDPNQEFRVEIRDTTDRILETAFSTNPGDPLFQELTARSFDLSAYAGQTIRIAFVEQDDQLFFNVHLDDIVVGREGSRGTIPVIVLPDEDLVDINFGNYVFRGSISGQKWNDLNQDGVKDPDEPALAGWTIYLDADNSESLNGDEKFTVTAANGTYSFTDLLPGNYVVRDVPLPGWSATFPLVPASARIAVFDDPEFVDSSDTINAESDNVQATLASLGFTVTTFSGTSASNWSDALAEADAVLIPELENGDLGSSLLPDALAVLRNYVNSGGGLIVHGAYAAPSLTAHLLNTVFGFSVIEGYASDNSYLKKPAAAGTQFSNDAFDLPLSNGTAYLHLNTLPAGSISLYDGSFQTVVGLMSSGSGQIVYLGYDWFDAAPVGSQDGGWLEVLNSAVREVAITRGVPGPHHLTIAPNQDLTGINFGSFRNVVSGSADFDSDGDVDGRDFLAWQRSYGSTSGAGDADGDGIANGNDLAVWQESYGQTPEIIGFVAEDNDEPAAQSADATAFWVTSLVSPEIVSAASDVTVNDSQQLESVDDAFSQLGEPTSWQGDDFGDIAVCRDAEEAEAAAEFEELLLAAF